MPPNNSKKSDQKSDIWSLGCILMDIVKLESGIWYSNIIENDSTWLEEQLKQISKYYSHELIHIIRECLLIDPEDRISIKRLKNQVENIITSDLIHYDILKWKVDDVLDWCEKNDFKDCIDIFKKNGIDGKALSLLDKNDLHMMGINTIGTIIKLINEIQQLKKN